MKCVKVFKWNNSLYGYENLKQTKIVLNNCNQGYYFVNITDKDFKMRFRFDYKDIVPKRVIPQSESGRVVEFSEKQFK